MSTGEHAVAEGQAGLALGRYVIEKEMGSGGAGAVYAARDTELDVRVCVKTFHESIAKSPNTLLRIKREVLLSRRVSHPGVCRVFDFQSVDGQPLVIMEYVEGKPLYEFMKIGEPMVLAQALDLILQMSDAVAAAHDVDVVHRDLKPDNILVTSEGRTKIIDFGIATAGDMEELTSPGVILGTLDFIAPEIWTGERAAAGADIWALGSLAYLLLSGRLPYEVRDDYGIYEAVKSSEAVPLHQLVPQLSPAVSRAIMGALEKDPKKRYRHGRLFHQALEAAMKAGTHVEANAVAAVRAPTSTDLAPLERITSAYQQRSTLHEEVDLPGSVATLLDASPPGRTVPLSWVAGGVFALLLLGLVGFWAWPESADPADSIEQARAAIIASAEERRRQAEAQRAEDQRLAAEQAEAARAAQAEEEAETPRPHKTMTPGLKAVTDARRAMRKRGLITGDDRTLDGLMSKARAELKAGREDAAIAKAEKARARVKKVSINRRFVDTKLSRLNRRFARVKKKSAKERALPLFKTIAGQVRNKQWSAANRTLNRAFAALR